MTLEALDEQVVEGHTVFSVLERESVRRGFDIVIKVREVRRGPNVLWFNDQWKTFVEDVRQPCGGYVIAVNTGMDVQGLGNLAAALVLTPASAGGLGAEYVESYHITDPNGHVWDTDLYQIDLNFRKFPVWISSVFNAGIPDDGVSHCDGYLDLAPHKPIGSNGLPYYDNVDNTPIREYNADIFGLMSQVTGAGSKQHGVGGAHDSDGTGCENNTEWECDAVNSPTSDDREGNSHPYNPNEADSGPRHSHTAGRLDVYFISDFNNDPFWTNMFGRYPPATRNYRVFDNEQVESEIKGCEPWDPFNNILNGYHDHC